MGGGAGKGDFSVSLCPFLRSWHYIPNFAVFVKTNGNNLMRFFKVGGLNQPTPIFNYENTWSTFPFPKNPVSVAKPTWELIKLRRKIIFRWYMGIVPWPSCDCLSETRLVNTVHVHDNNRSRHWYWEGAGKYAFYSGMYQRTKYKSAKEHENFFTCTFELST